MSVKKLFVIPMIALATSLGACGGGGGGSSASAPPPVSGVTLSGTVAAPGGVIAFNGPSWTERLAAWVIGSSAHAALVGTLPVGAGVTVNLIEIDAAGNQVGNVIASGVTNASGGFTIHAPANFFPGAQYVARAVGTTGNMDAIVTDTAGSIVVDSSTEATKQLVLASVVNNGATLASVPTTAVNELQGQVETISYATDTSGIGALTAANLAGAILAESQNNQEVSNIANSIAASGVIRGRVTSTTGAGLPNIKVVVRDFNNWLTRAQTHTDASGNYMLNVPPSATQGYIVGAFNFTGNAAMSASEWFTTGGGAPAPIGAERVTVTAGIPVTINLQLDNGARIAGTVTSDTGTPLPGVLVLLRDVATGFPVTWMHSRADGSYTLNVWPNRPYTLSARNNTLQPYATGTYNGLSTGGTTTNGGALLQDGGTTLNLSAGTASSMNFALQSGSKIAGCVTEPPAPTPTGADPCAGAGSAVGGIAVRYFSNFADSSNGGFVESPRTNKDGRYRMWVKPGLYTVRARGQVQSPDVTSSNAYLPFSAQVGMASLTVTSNGSTPVSQVKVQLYDYANAASPVYKGFEATQSDGTVEVYTDTPGNAQRMVFLVDGNQAGVGTAVYNGTSTSGLNLSSGTNVSLSITPGATNLGVIALPPGYTLSGNISAGAGGVRVLQLRNGGTAAANILANTRAQGDGSYSINLQAAANYYGRICNPTPPAPGTCTVFVGPTTMPAADTTLNY